jgi:5'-3' exonuclease
MGIRHLNRFLLNHCSHQSIHKIGLKYLYGKTVVVDTSIYMYKFMEKNALLENMFQMISIFRKYNIIPVFIFDGKPPKEKKDLLVQRKTEKQEAELRYNELKQQLDNVMESRDIDDDDPDTPYQEDLPEKEDIISEMETLKKKFIRLRESDIQAVKQLISSYGIMYIESYGEADQLCAYLVKNNYAWACVSDDMDMFAYGCSRVLRHVSLIQHTGILYEIEEILCNLDIPFADFRDILILSGTDYNIRSQKTLQETMEWYKKYTGKNGIVEHYNCDRGHSRDNKTFYDWLMDAGYLNAEEKRKLDKIVSMFDLTMMSLRNTEEIRAIIEMLPFQYKTIEKEKLHQILREDGFVFL